MKCWIKMKKIVSIKHFYITYTCILLIILNLVNSSKSLQSQNYQLLKNVDDAQEEHIKNVSAIDNDFYVRVKLLYYLINYII
jgi:hypothetical protein